MAAPLTIVVESDDSEYSRFEPDHSVIGFTVAVTGSLLTNEEITVELVKSRRNRDVSIAYVTLVLDQAGDASYTGEFNLVDIVDTYGVPKARRGSYFIRATSVTDEDITAESEDFLISLITLNRLKNDYLFGQDLKATDELGPLEQPKVITGVTITQVSTGHAQEWIPLSYNVVDAGGGNFVRTLSWCGGPQVTIVSGTKFYVLRRGDSADWIRVKVVILDLPVSTVGEDILITTKDMSDVRLRAMVDQAISWIEDVELQIFLEPTLVTTQATAGTVPDDSDIPVFVDTDWDEVVNAVTYKQPTAGHWMNFKLPYKPLIRFNELYGIVAGARMLEMDLSWVKIHEKTGFVELMPFNQSSAFNFLGLSFVQSLRGAVDLPNFWNFEALCGFRDLPPILLEIVAKKAAIDVLIIAGAARRAGISSQSISRDSVAESISYTASATASTFSATIEDYRKFIENNLKHLRGAFTGLRMSVL